MPRSELYQKLRVEHMVTGAAQETAGEELARVAYSGGGNLPPPADSGRDWGDGDRGMSDLLGRVTRLEYGLIASFLILAGMIGGLYLHVGNQDSAVRDRLAAVESTTAEIRGDIKVLDTRMGNVEKKIDQIDGKLDKALAR